MKYALLLMPQPPTENSWYIELFASPKTEEVGGSYDLINQNSTRKYEDDLQH